MPTSLIVYVLAVLACDLGLIGWQLAATPLRGDDLLLFGALLAAAVICMEAMRRLGQPSRDAPGGWPGRRPGVSRDLLSAWWLPIALLLPPPYVLLAPLAVGAVLCARARRIPVYRQAFGSAALGLAGAVSSATFHLAVPDVVLAGAGAERAWLTRPSVILAAVACAVLFAVVNSFTVAVAAHLADPGEPIANMLWDRETLLLDLTGTCAGILVAVTCALSYLLLLVALPPVILLESDVVGRFGGEEFTILLPRTDGAGAYGIAERLRASAANLSVAAADTRIAADARISVTVSIGVAVLGHHGNDLFELLAAADVALYRAKEAGRDRVHVYAHSAGKAAASDQADEATDACPQA